MGDVVIAIDAGTTSVRVVAVTRDGRIAASAQREFPQYFPEPGWVEHDLDEIWSATASCLDGVLAACKSTEPPMRARGIGITNQRETVAMWDATGPAHRAIVWQDRRTAGRCADLAEHPEHTDFVRARTGLVIDPYFSATKLAWLRDAGVAAEMAGTIDSFLIWKLTGRHVTDPSNASRTLLYDIHDGRWSSELCDLFGVDPSPLPEVVPSSGLIATAQWQDLPVAGVAGDQQAALFGNACILPGQSKTTYGTGSFVLVNTGRAAPPPTAAVLTTVAWDLGDGPVYALEGSIFVTGATVHWLRDQLGIIGSANEVETLAASVADTGGVYLVPAFAGLGAPHWSPDARAAIFGLSRSTSKAHIARAAVEAMAFQTRDVITALPVEVPELRVDGGAATNDWLLQFQADILQIPVRRPVVTETTALGAAFLAGLAVGMWESPDAIAETWKEDRTFEPSISTSTADDLYAGWLRALERVL